MPKNDWERFENEVEQLHNRVKALTQTFSHSSTQTRSLLIEALEELHISLEELRVAEEELADAHQELEVERQRYQDLFNFAPDGYLVTDAAGKILEANRSAAVLLQVRQEFLLGKILPQFVPEEDRKAFRLHLNRLKSLAQTGLVEQERSHPPSETERPTWEVTFPEIELRLQPRKAPAFDAALTVAWKHDGQELSLLWLVRDMTYRKTARLALQASENKFKALTETTSVAIFLVQNGKICYANPAASHVSGYEIAELLGKEFLDLIHPEKRSAFSKGIAAPRPLDSESQYIPAPLLYRQEMRMSSRGGEQCWVDVAIGIIEMDDGPAWIVTAYDITQRIRAERTRKELARRLVRVQEEERSRLSRELHDQMGQSLAALLLGLKTIEELLPGGSPGRQLLKQLQNIADEISQEVHRVAIELRPASLDDLGLEPALTFYAEEWSKLSGIPVDLEVTSSVDEPLPSAISTTVFRIVKEALTNILKHAQASQVSLIIVHRPDQVRAIIEDNGCGFDTEKTTKVPNGTRRLGLLGMAERAELAGGSFSVESEVGKGTAVYISIPLNGGGIGSEE